MGWKSDRDGMKALVKLVNTDVQANNAHSLRQKSTEARKHAREKTKPRRKVKLSARADRRPSQQQDTRAASTRNARAHTWAASSSLSLAASFACSSSFALSNRPSLSLICARRTNTRGGQATGQNTNKPRRGSRGCPHAIYFERSCGERNSAKNKGSPKVVRK